jgi:hypothetical protein
MSPASKRIGHRASDRSRWSRRILRLEVAQPPLLVPVCRATLIMSPCGDIRNVPFWRRYDNRNVP